MGGCLGLSMITFSTRNSLDLLQIMQPDKGIGMLCPIKFRIFLGNRETSRNSSFIGFTIKCRRIKLMQCKRLVINHCFLFADPE